MNRNSLSLLLLLLTFLTANAAIEPSDAKLNKDYYKRHSPKELKKDVDYIHKKLTKLHPDLYHYIGKKELDYKFDSLKTTITDSLTSSEFYFKISPVIASIRQGHTLIFPSVKRLSPKVQSSVKKTGTSPLVKFDFLWNNEQLIVAKNYAGDTALHVGCELVSVNGIKPKEVIEKYRNTFTSDGFNTTFIDAQLGRRFPSFLYYEKGVIDTANCVVKENGTLHNVQLIRLPKPAPTVKSSPKTAEQLKKERAERYAESERKHLQGYDPLRKRYSKELTFTSADSSIAILRISDFTQGSYKKFYKQTFDKLDRLKTKTLILDLRDNGGGRISEINVLYSYLADTTFTLIDKPEVTRKTSFWDNGYFETKNPISFCFRLLFSPIMIGADTYFFFKTKKGEDGKYYFSIKDSKPTPVAENRFKGKVYVLINGGCFSATSIISTHMKAQKRATFVGEETGGAYNGCVAGFMPSRTLPNSDLTVLFGLMVCQAPYKAEPDGRGIFPDKELVPTEELLRKEGDPLLKWVLDEVKKEATR